MSNKLILVLGFIVLWHSTQVHSCDTNIEISFTQVSADEKVLNDLKSLVTTAVEAADDVQTFAQSCEQTNIIHLTDVINSIHRPLVSQFTLPAIPGFTLYSSAKSPKPAKVIVQRHRPYQLNYTANSYLVDDDSRTTGLLNNGRVDGIIDYTANSPIYRRDISELNTEELTESAPVYVVFENTELLQHFELGVTTLQAQSSNSNFKKQTVTRQDNIQIDWLLLNKYFSKEKDALVALQEEVDIGKWIDNKLPNYQLNIESMSTALAIERLKNQNNACLAGVFQTEERKQYALFSDIYVYYLRPRIYVANNSPFHQQLMAFVDEQGAVNIIEALNKSRRATMGFSPSTTRQYKALTELLESNTERFVNIDTFERRRMLQLLEKGRIDSLIEYPSNIKQLLRNEIEIRNLTSFKLAPVNKPVPTYIACSKSARNAEFLQVFNDLLQDPQSKFEYIQLISRGFTDSATADIHRVAGTFEQWQAHESNSR